MEEGKRLYLQLLESIMGDEPGRADAELVGPRRLVQVVLNSRRYDAPMLQVKDWVGRNTAEAEEIVAGMLGFR